jgi:hypothetical protein
LRRLSAATSWAVRKILLSRLRNYYRRRLTYWFLRRFSFLTIRAELRLRNLPLPEHRVQEALEAMRKRIAETKPESFDAVAERVAQLRQRREKKKH